MRLRGILLLFFCCSFFSFGQDFPRIDTTIVHSDSVKTDTTKKIKDPSGIDTIVTYTGVDSIVFFYKTKIMSLYKKSDIKYQQMELQAERIDVDWNTTVLTAFGIHDTTDTTHTKMVGNPIMKDGPEEYHGKALGYDFKTKRGRITLADTKIDQGYYHGETIKKVGQDILFVANGRYTTCDDPDPHYYFGSPTMKITPGDKVIASPVYLYIEDVPVFWLPLGVFPSESGRRSGLIAPAITEDATHGRMLHHVGYYWAINDYMDVNALTDLYTKGSWALYSDFRYNLRYYLRGGISGQYKKLIEGEPSDPGRSVSESYLLSIEHHQSIDPTTNLDVNFTFASNNAYQNTIDMNQALQQDITSNATISKSWEGTPNSMSVNFGRRQDLVNGSLYETLPSVSFNHSESYPFRSDKKTDASNLSWYENIGVGYSANYTNTRNRVATTVNGIKSTINGVDTLVSSQQFEIDRNQALTQNINATIAPKLGYFTISPSLSYGDTRSFSNNDVPGVSAADSSLTVQNEQQTTRAGYITSAVTASTKLYGMLQPGLFGIAAIRHTLTPNLSLSYSKQIVGDNLQPKQMVANLSLGNVFEMKMAQPEEDKEPTKITLMNLGVGVSYNFSADSLNFSPITMNYHTAIGSLLDIGGDAAFDLYKLDQPIPGYYNRVNTFLISSEGRLARLTQFDINMSTSFSGAQNPSRKNPSTSGDSVARTPISNSLVGYNPQDDPDFSIPWKLSLSMDFSENKVPGQQSRSAAVNGQFDFNLTENWKVSTRSGYDIVNRQFEMPDINVSRDLHCWLLNFDWVPTGEYRHYSLEIRLKAPQLRDLKITKQGSDRGIY